MDAFLAAPSPAGSHFPTTAHIAPTVPPPAAGSDPASRIRDDPIVHQLTDALLHRLNYHRSDTVSAAPPAGMPDVCQILAERNATTHVLQRQTNPAPAPTPPPAPPALETGGPPVPPPTGSPDSDLGDVTTTFLELDRPEPASDGRHATPLHSSRLSISAHRAGSQAVNPDQPALAPLPPPGPPLTTTSHASPPRSPSDDFVPPFGSQAPASAAPLDDLAPVKLQFENPPTAQDDK